jgi:hypothetical protein
MKDLEFVITGPIFTDWSWLSNAAWAKIELHADGKTLHLLHFIVRPGGWLSYQLLPHMRSLSQMYFSTTRGLTP